MRTRRALALALVAVTAALGGTAAALPAAAGDQPSHGPSNRGPALVSRATLSADFLADGPPSGAAATPANGRTGPFAGQVIPGFSGALDNGDGTFWGLPDNGFGSKANSADFLLRLYLVTPDWASGQIQVGRHVQLRDPDGHVDFALTRPDRLLTGADFDVESVQRAADGTLWVGEEFGPFLLHFSADGVLLSPPVAFPDGRSPANPYLAPGETPRVGSSRGFEALAMSSDGRRLYPVVEGAFTDDPQQRRRWVYEFDTRTQTYTGRTWQYETDATANVVGDAQWVGKDRLWLVERDDHEGAAAVTKRVYEVDLRRTDRDGYAPKTLVLDALRIADPDGVSAGGGYGTGETFAFPVQSFETIVPLGRDRVLLANDTNYPGNAARVPGTPDATEMVVVDLRGARLAKPDDTLVVGHRGASGYRPEHTLAAYETAILQCADYIEPDLVSTKDGVLVARHENEIGGTTDVAARPEFADRRTTKSVDGVSLTGWFTEDFTLAELRTLRAKERIPAVRPANTAFDGKYQVPTFDEVLDLARHSRTCSGEPVGVYPETKHPTYFDGLGLSLEEPLLADLAANGFDGRKAPVVIQSFETANLRELSTRTRLPLAQLVNCSGQPWDLAVAGDPRTYADLVTRAGLREVARYADGIGACKDVLIPRDASGALLAPSPVIRDAHRAGLTVHGWTFRAENQFLPTQFRVGTDPVAHGDLTGEIRTFLRAGMDGFFTDFPDVGAAAAR
ncbi:esterase-like activity of phytase family protein [Cellulomonas fimi]|uniref:glycerophosphodiester phosphodiesterase n=1 Tax=Cellulomonas fimi (strain ATCC 484 / DSM 20113 / JCM 1341 / CCUG 24087 / LMG 16345 / NBRC 15513 / NCIMB 8980 / NCTC 7547 / NRS-133) TaxID=590998 RepID=F4H4V8_CELFA|nr:esterase-like activity of phytase family protein [Cellulomonas fimi]AEE45438.1 glycerophosphoryl diester phosphodiesterase [Cellulomonas fimi ATCC 484]NNH06810.1 glycerophosphodiester phosphodiesterase [Cellulomonas fimi]VEH29390.1 Glycerophosphoryl diester phosphodiesterase precursor [Cellulomonas fimi]